MTNTIHEHVCKPTWSAHAVARFWEPGVEEFARKRLYLPDGAHVQAADYDRLRIAPFAEKDGPTPGNLLIGVGLTALLSQLKSGTKDWAASSAGSGFTGLAVGTGTTTAVIGDTDLTGGSKSYRVCDDTYPTISTDGLGGHMTFQVTYASGEANFSWDEYAALVPNGSASAASGSAASSKAAFGGGNYILLNHKAPAGLGVKANGAPATLNLVITIT